ncbi:MAG: SH3 domain-containing protein, partial [Phycisphaerales bacterium]|nr:SH3 domain-containing protein [Phycisphaerales bacterium]
MNSDLLHRMAGRVAMAAVLLLLVGPAVAWQDDDPAKTAPIWKASRSNNLLVRSGPSTNDYLVTKIKKGDPVLVAEMRDGKWAGVRMVGPTFAKVGLLLELDDRVRVDGDEAVIVKGRVSLMAPNESSRPADAEDAQVDPNRSTRPVLRLEPEARLTITDRFEDAGRSFVVVEAPPAATLWVFASFLEDATPEQIPAAFRVKPAATAAEPTSAVPVVTTEPVAAEAAVVELVDEDEATEATTSGGVAVVVVVEEVDDPAAIETTDATADTTEPAAEDEPVDPLADVTIEEAEAAWEAVKKSPHDDAELEALQLVFVSIAARETAPVSEKRLAELRIRQIELRREVRNRLDKLNDATGLNQQAVTGNLLQSASGPLNSILDGNNDKVNFGVSYEQGFL